MERLTFSPTGGKFPTGPLNSPEAPKLKPQAPGNHESTIINTALTTLGDWSL